MEKNFKNTFPVSGIFPGKADSVILLCFECAINPQNLIKIVGAIFEKNKVFNFFLMWTTLNFRGRGKTKKTARDIYKRTLDIEFERDRSIGLGSTIGDGQTQTQTHTHTHTHTFFLKHIFRLWEWCRTKNHFKKSKSTFSTIAILPSLLMSLESKKNIILVTRIFFGKSWECYIVGVRMHNKSTKSDENRWIHFWEN